MSDYDRRREITPREPTAPSPQRDIVRNHPGALQVFGELSSIARRYRLRQLEKVIDQERAVIVAHHDLLAAQEAWRRAELRLQPEVLESVLDMERAKIRAEQAEENLRLKEALRKVETFEKKAAIEDDELEAEALEAKIRLKRLRAEYHGDAAAAPSGNTEPPVDHEAELLKIVTALGELERERGELLQATEPNDAAVSAVDAKISALLRRKGAIEERLAALP